METVLAQALSLQSIGYFLIAAVVIGGVWYLFDQAPVNPAMKQIVNVVLVVMLIVVAIKFLLGVF